MIEYAMKVAFISTVLLASATLAASADDLGVCNATLIVDHVSSQSEIAQNIAILKTITEQEFQEAERKISVAGEVLVGPIYVQPDMKWSDFQEKSRQYLDQYSFQMTDNSAYTYNAAYLGQGAVKAYSDCLLAAGKNTGTHIWAVEAAPDTLHTKIHVEFVTDGGDKTFRSMEILPIGGKVSLTQLATREIKKFSGAKGFDFDFVRDSIDTDAGVEVSVSGSDKGTATLEFPARQIIYFNHLKREPFKFVDLPKNTTTAHEQQGGIKCYPETPEEAKESEGYTIVPNSLVATADTSGNPGDHSESAAYLDHIACLRWHIGGDANGSGYGAHFKLIGERQKPERIVVSGPNAQPQPADEKPISH